MEQYNIDGNMLALNRREELESNAEKNREAFYQEVKESLEEFKELVEHIKAVAVDYNEEDFCEQLLEDTISEM